MTGTRQLHKFGGSSLADPECYQRVATILAKYSQYDDLIVVSASGDTTNQLINWLNALNKNEDVAHELLMNLHQFQSDLIEKLLDKPSFLLDQLHTEISILDNISAPFTPEQEADILGHGEMWSCRLLSAWLTQENMPSVFLDSRSFLRAENGIQPEVDCALSKPLLKKILAQHTNSRLIITGFMARNLAGDTVLLGRNGSDYSATVIGALAEVSHVTIWSDVCGVYSADPRKISDACLLPLLRLDEASELARLGAPILHSRTLQPVAQSAMKLKLRCSHQAGFGSTRIERVLASGRGAKIITSLDEVLLIELIFGDAHDFKRASNDVLQSLQQAQLSPLAFEAQADQRIVLMAYTTEAAPDVLRYLNDVAVEADIRLKQGCSFVAAVGAGVTKNPIHSDGFYQQLKNSPVEFMCEAESGLSLSAVLRTSDILPLVQRIHAQLFQAVCSASSSG